ncbi:ANTAR domain-containing protein [Vibrio fluvialis]|nr:ANTAR domain-containing protein [Vibrio fluvialis]ELV8726122.1 ANTAR domain-containing protein [Vibrio fluvialis]
MSLSHSSQSIVVCCDSVSDQAGISAKLALHYDQILLCQLAQLERMIDKESSPTVVVSWRQPSAELRLIVEFCSQRKVPLLVILKQLQVNDINRLPQHHDFVLLPFDSAFELKPWIDYAKQVRETSMAMAQEIESLTQKLEERKWVEKAKGMLMRLHGLDEDKAYRALRSSAMQSSLSLAQVAKNVIHTMEGLGV